MTVRVGIAMLVRFAMVMCMHSHMTVALFLGMLLRVLMIVIMIMIMPMSMPVSVAMSVVIVPQYRSADYVQSKSDAAHNKDEHGVLNI